MVCYYPQRTTLPMGPTELLPGSQYYRGDSDREHYSRGHIPDFGEQMREWSCTPHAATCEAGTCVLMHFDPNPNPIPNPIPNPHRHPNPKPKPYPQPQP